MKSEKEKLIKEFERQIDEMYENKNIDFLAKCAIENFIISISNIGSGCDIFATNIPELWIQRTINHLLINSLNPNK